MLPHIYLLFIAEISARVKEEMKIEKEKAIKEAEEQLRLEQERIAKLVAGNVEKA